jgi:hypothetical protein
MLTRARRCFPASGLPRENLLLADAKADAGVAVHKGGACERREMVGVARLAFALRTEGNRSGGLRSPGAPSASFTALALSVTVRMLAAGSRARDLGVLLDRPRSSRGRAVGPPPCRQGTPLPLCGCRRCWRSPRQCGMEGVTMLLIVVRERPTDRTAYHSVLFSESTPNRIVHF